MLNLTHLLFVYDQYGETGLMQPFSALGARIATHGGLRLDLRAVNVLHVESHQPLRVQQQYKLGEHLVDLVLHAVAEAVDGDEVGLLVARKPDEMDVTLERGLDLAAGVVLFM